MFGGTGRTLRAFDLDDILEGELRAACALFCSEELEA
jgi:hypothetical protein